MAEAVLRLRVAGQADTQGALQALGQQAKATASTIQQASNSQAAAFGRVRTSMVDVGAALAGVAATASFFARGNPELQRQLEVLSLTTSGLGTSLRAAAAAMKVVVGVIGLKVAILGAAVIGVVLLIRHWEEAKAAAVRIWGSIRDFFAEVFGGIAQVFQGLGTIIAGVFTGNFAKIQEGTAQLQKGLGSLKDTAVDLGAGVKGLATAGLDRMAMLLLGTGDAAKTAAAKLKAALDLESATIVAFNTWQRAEWEKAAQERQRIFIENSDKIIAAQKAEQAAIADLIDTYNAQLIKRIDDEEEERIAAAQRMLAAEKAKADAIIAEQQRVQSAVGASLGNILKGTGDFGGVWTALWAAIVDKVVAELMKIVAVQNLINSITGPGGILGGILGIFGIRLQHGGIVTQPALAMVGEAGPEVVAPLSKLPQLIPSIQAPASGGRGTITVNFTHQGPLMGNRMEARQFALQIMEQIRREADRR